VIAYTRKRDLPLPATSPREDHVWMTVTIGDGHLIGRTHYLSRMANDVGNFFRAQSNRDEAITGITNHIKSFWTPRMRQQLISRLGEDDGLDELPREAMRRIAEHPNAKGWQPAGGDAG
jgi:formate dehydrogenase subunit delta